mgnify:FL=1
MKLLSGTFSKPNKILSIRIQYKNEGWVEYKDTRRTGVPVGQENELLIIVRKYKKGKRI